MSAVFYLYNSTTHGEFYFIDIILPVFNCADEFAVNLGWKRAVTIYIHQVTLEDYTPNLRVKVSVK